MIPGGLKMRHESSMTIQLRRGKWLYRSGDKWVEQAPQKPDDGLTDTAEAKGVEFKAHVEKNRVGTQGRRAVMHYEYATRKFDYNFELVKAAEYLEIVEKGGSWYTLPNGEKVQGEARLGEALDEDVELRAIVLGAIEQYIVKNP